MSLTPVVALCVNGGGLIVIWRVLRNAFARTDAGIVALRKEVADYRSAHQNEREACDRRMGDMEAVVADAATEMRLTAGQLSEFLSGGVRDRWRPAQCSPRSACAAACERQRP